MDHEGGADRWEAKRVGAGVAAELRHELVDPATLVDRALAAAWPLIQGRGQALTLAIGPGVPQLFADRRRLEWLLAELLVEAAALLPDGARLGIGVAAEGGRVSVRLRDSAADGSRAPGAALEAHLRLEGTRRSVEQQGGELVVRTCAGHGLDLLLRLPAAETTLAARRPSRPFLAAPLGAPAAGSAKNQKRRVLVVDDSTDTAEILAIYLELAGNAVRVANDGAGALDEAACFEPEAAILDIGLPGMDGLELARRLRALPPLAGCRLVALTGFSDERLRARSAAVGFERHFVKPIDPRVIVDLLARPPAAAPRA